MTRTWNDNAHEFGALTKQGKDVRLALLVACSVEKGTGQGARGPRNDRSKVGAREFAIAAGTTHPRISRHLDAWNKVAPAHLQSANLTPEMVDAIEVDDALIAAFEAGFDATDSGGRPRASQDEIIKRISEDDAYGKQIVEKAIAANPKVAEAAREAVLQADMDRVNDPARVARIKNNPEVKAVAARHAEGKEVVRAITMFGNAIRDLEWIGANWGDLWEKASEFERGTLIEQMRQAEAEIGVITMYAETQVSP